jgi:hypothetical protein
VEKRLNGLEKKTEISRIFAIKKRFADKSWGRFQDFIEAARQGSTVIIAFCFVNF